MQINLKEVSKKFESEWIFKRLSLNLEKGQAIVIKGGNGSGKSTLLGLLSGKSLPSKGEIEFQLKDKVIEADEVYKYISLASPSLELIEEFTLNQLLDIHFKLKKVHSSISLSDIPKLLMLEKHANRSINYYSSGMRQRVKLGLAILSDTPILLLDEPCSNLDKKGIAWYQNLVERFKGDRIIAVASNEKEEEYPFVQGEISIEDYK